MMFKPGDKVVLIDNSPNLLVKTTGMPMPIPLGEVVTVTGYTPESSTQLTLEEYSHLAPFEWRFTKYPMTDLEKVIYGV